jgi:hypothetical protein
LCGEDPADVAVSSGKVFSDPEFKARLRRIIEEDREMLAK